MKCWDIAALDLRPHSPQILSSTDDARAIVLAIPAGESLQDHQVHERAWMAVLDGDVQIIAGAGEEVSGGPGLMVELAPQERHAVHTRSGARLLLFLTPWPGRGHPGAMTLDQKAHAVERAAAQKQNASRPVGEPPSWREQAG